MPLPIFLLCLILGPLSGLISAPVSAAHFFGFSDGTGTGLSPEAAHGLSLILEGEDYHYGLPVRLFNKVAKENDFSVNQQWRVFGNLPSPTWRFEPRLAAPLPLGQSVFSRSGALVLNQNCFSCHAGVVAGSIVAGLGSAHIDAVSFQAQGEDLVQQWDQPFKKLLLSFLLTGAEMDQLRGYTDYLRSLVLPTIQAESRGDIHGPWVVWRLIARMRNPAQGFAFYPADQMAPLESILDRPLPTVRPQPWWRLKYKKRAFWNADVSAHSDATFALNLMDPHPSNTATFPQRLERTRLELEFARQTEAPPYPWRKQTDWQKANEGWKYFHGEKKLANGKQLLCAGCHGTYAAGGSLKNFPEVDPIGIDFLGTDPAYSALLNGPFRTLYAHFEKSPFSPSGSDAVVPPEYVGYAPPPLVGIWAAGPYFHNGSVPDVYGVLKSSARPTLWQKDLDPKSYNRERLGVNWYSVTAGEFTQWKGDAEKSASVFSAESLRVRRVYNTKSYGKTNSGHLFGEEMNESERMAVIEYLKLL